MEFKLRMKIKLDVVLTAILVLCAVVTTGVVIRREFMTPRATSAQAEQKSVLIPQWRDDLIKGVRLGPDAAPVQLIEFADFECPYCGSFHKNLKGIEAKYPGQIVVTYFHYPIPGHRFALPAARVSECAAEQGRFEAMHDKLFEGQDQFGLKPWVDYATAAGVPDMAAFDVCIKKTDPIPRVEEGKAWGAKLDVQGTPTVIINGWKLGHPPSEQELDQMVKRVLSGKPPVDGKS
jgi:protein-disulfide isomerase